MRTSESTAELVKALVAAHKTFAPVRKDARGQVGQNREYWYADLAGMLDATMPALLEHNLVVLQAVDAETSSLITRLAHISGEWAESAYPLPLDLPPQQFGAALTYARRYSLQSLLCLAAEDDTGAAVPRPAKRNAAGAQPPANPGDSPVAPDGRISQAQRRHLFEVAKMAGWSTDAMRDHLRSKYGIQSSDHVLESAYNRVVADFNGPPPAH